MTFKTIFLFPALLIAAALPSAALAKQSSLTGTITKISSANGECHITLLTGKKVAYVADVTNAYIVARGKADAAPEFLQIGDAVSINGFVTGADVIANFVKATAAKKSPAPKTPPPPLPASKK